MAIEVYCFKCGKELEEPGAILLGPPESGNGLVLKSHICVHCYVYFQSLGL